MLKQAIRLCIFMVIPLLLCAACGQAEESNTDITNPQPTAAATEAASGETEGDANSEAGPCSYVTDAEVGEAIGKTVSRHEENSGQCTYYTDDPVVFVTLEVDTENAESSWQGVTGGTSLAGGETNKVEGLGEEAFFGARDILYVKDGDIFMSLEAGFDTETRERARKLAPIVLVNLKR
jgi:hypothetical protein